MEYFFTSSGNNRPVFIYRFKVSKCTTEMYEWAASYPEQGPFSRFHVEWQDMFTKMDRPINYDVIQFEHSEAAKIFRIAFAGEYEDISMDGYR